MSALIFPKTRQNDDPLQPDDEYIGGNGVTYIYDGVKWVGHSQNLTPGTSALVNNSNIAQLDVDGNFELPSFTLVNSTGTAGQTLTWPTTGTVLTWTYFNPSQLINGAYIVELNDDGTLNFPNNTIDAGTSSIAVASYVNSELAWHNNNITGDAQETLDAYVGVDSSGTYIVNESTNSDSTGTNINVWYFDPSGILRIGRAGSGPYGLVQNIGADIVDGNGNSLVYVTSTATAPVSSPNGQLWFNSVEGRAYIKYQDVWVDLSPTVIPQPSTYLDELSISGTTISQTNTTGTEAVIINNNTSSWQFGADGVLIFPDDTMQSTAWTGSTSQLANGTWTFAVSSTGVVTLNGTAFVSGGASSSDRLTTGSYSMVLGADGILTFPGGNLQIGDSGGGSAIVAATNTTVVMAGQGVGGAVALQWIDITTSTSTVAAVTLNSMFSSSTGTVQILTGEITGPVAANIWEFGADGALTFPDGTTSTTAWNTSTSVYPHQMVSGSTSTIHFLSAAGTYITPPERPTYDPPTSNPNNITCVFTPTRGDNVVTTTTTIARAFTTATFHYNINLNAAGEWLSISKWAIGVSGITDDGY
jgi:hypothetical protein